MRPSGSLRIKLDLPHLEGIVYVGLRSLLAAKKKLQVMTEGMKILEDVCHEYHSSMAGKYMIVHSVNAAGIVNDTYYLDKLVS